MEAALLPAAVVGSPSGSAFLPVNNNKNTEEQKNI